MSISQNATAWVGAEGLKQFCGFRTTMQKATRGPECVREAQGSLQRIAGRVGAAGRDAQAFSSMGLRVGTSSPCMRSTLHQGELITESVVGSIQWYTIMMLYA